MCASLVPKAPPSLMKEMGLAHFDQNLGLADSALPETGTASQSDCSYLLIM